MPIKKETPENKKNQKAVEIKEAQDFKAAVKALLKGSEKVKTTFDGNNWTLSGSVSDDFKKIKEAQKELS